MLTFARYERALQPKGVKYDTREWEEDFEARLAHWRANENISRTQDDHRRGKPKRAVSTLYVDPDRQPRGVWGRGAHRRDIPWDPDTWSQLGVFALRFGQLHQGLMAYLIDADQDVFLARLADMSGRMLPAPGDT